MQKFIAAFDGLRFSQSTLDYAVHLAKLSNTHLIGVFLDNILYNSYQYAELVDEEEGGVSERKRRLLNEQDKIKRDEAALSFEQACHQAKITFAVHRDRNASLQELLHESIYADLLVINQTETFTYFEEEAPTAFIRNLLSDVQCPVLVVSKSYHPIEKLVLLYDGEPSSVYAIKMFGYLLPQLGQLPTEVLTIKSHDQPIHVPESRLMKEFIKRHFSNVEYIVKQGIVEEQILGHLQYYNPHCLIVVGGYQRSRVSKWFRRSMADHLLQYTKLPLFIAHNK